MCEEPQNPVDVDVETEDEAKEPDWAAAARNFEDLYLRNAAEMENMRRRFQREKEEQIRYAAERVIKGLLPVLDHLSLALSYVKEDAGPETLNLAEGVRMTLKGFQDVLTENGLSAIEAERGQAFDPNIHEAFGQEAGENLPAGAISREIQKGYSLNGRLIRPAKVMVAP